MKETRKGTQKNRKKKTATTNRKRNQTRHAKAVTPTMQGFG